VAAEGPQKGGGGEEEAHAQAVQALVEGGWARVIGPVLQEEARPPEEEGSVEAEGVAHDPEEVGGGVEDFSGLQVKEVAQGPGHAHHVPPVAVDHPFGRARGARGVEEEEGVGGGDGEGLLGLALHGPLQKLRGAPPVPEDREVQAREGGLHRRPGGREPAPQVVPVGGDEEAGFAL
jgi:hypothetical protein